jgi:4a-hydroxytetrahydrobiopterin dehydratase
MMAEKADPQPLSDDEITARLAQLPGWERADDTITKTYKLERYMAGLAFASAVGTIAEGLDHHPDILIQWRKVTVTYYTHSAGNKITHKDFDAATAIEALPYKPRA